MQLADKMLCVAMTAVQKLETYQAILQVIEDQAVKGEIQCICEISMSKDPVSSIIVTLQNEGFDIEMTEDDDNRDNVILTISCAVPKLGIEKPEFMINELQRF